MVLDVKKEARKSAIKKGEKFKEEIKDYLDAKGSIPLGLNMKDEFAKNKQRILGLLGAKEKDWNSWQWQMKNMIKDVGLLREIIDIPAQQIAHIKRIEPLYRWSVSPYFASLMSRKNRECPVRIQSIPSIHEIMDNPNGHFPSRYYSPAPLISRIFPDRLIVNLTNRCATFCRHCLRREDIKDRDYVYPERDVELALDYIRKHEEIRDVLLTGGDPLTMSDHRLDWILTELDRIPHIEIKRLGTRIPVTLPQRITKELCFMLEKHEPLYINTQFNHPKEITEESKKACLMLSKSGIPLGNQAVLLKGINNHIHIIKKLLHELLKIKVRPYYLYHCKNVPGVGHFRTSVEDGIDIVRHLIGYTSGLAVPTFIVSAPDSLGKTPLCPQYLLAKDYEDGILIRAWNGEVTVYK